MQIKSTVLYVEINNLNYIFFVGNISENENLKLIDKINIPIKGFKNKKPVDFDAITEIIKNNIFILERKFNLVFKEVILLIDNFDCSILNFTGFKNLNGSQLTKENITYILNSLKSKVNELEENKKILHIFNSKFLLDKKNIENIPIGLFGNFYSHELSFFLIDKNDYKNLKNIFEGCNLKIRNIVSKKFVEGTQLINTNENLDTFFQIEINETSSQIFFFENSALRFFQDFEFGSDIIINDISKIAGLKNNIVKDILLTSDFFENNLEPKFIEKRYFNEQNYRKINKKLFLDVADERIQELAEIIISKNVNVLNYFQKKAPIFLRLSDISCSKIFNVSFRTHFSNKQTNVEIQFIKALEYESFLNNANKIVQFGWKKEAVPVVHEKKSIIARVFDFIFN